MVHPELDYVRAKVENSESNGKEMDGKEMITIIPKLKKTKKK